MSQGPLCPNLTKKVQKEVSQMANRNLSRVMLLGGLSVNLNHLIKIIVHRLYFLFILTDYQRDLKLSHIVNCKTYKNHCALAIFSFYSY